MKSKHRRLTLTLLIFFAVFFIFGTAQAQFYKGKTIKCIVPYAPGGGTDTFFRTLVPYWQKNVPGSPKMIIQNMPGAGGMTANNYVYESAKPDGMTVLTAPWLSMAQITKQPGARVRYEEMNLIGGQIEPIVVYLSNKIVPGGIQSAADIAKAKVIKLGGLRSSSNKDIRNLLSLELLGIPVKYVSGFRGGAKANAAILRGELDMFSVNYSQWVAMFKNTVEDEGIAKALWYQSGFDKAGNPITFAGPEKIGIIGFDKVYEQVKGRKPSGQLWEAYKWFMAVSTTFGLSAWLPPNAPPEAVEALRTGWYQAENDPEYIEASIKRFGAKQTFVPLDLGENTVKKFVGNPDPKMVKFFQDFIEKYKQ
jgi:hypothetical protein